MTSIAMALKKFKVCSHTFPTHYLGLLLDHLSYNYVSNDFSNLYVNIYELLWRINLRYY